MKAATAALTKKAVSNAKGRSFRRAFLGIAAETKFSCKYPDIRWCSRKSVSQDWKNYGKNKDATFVHLQQNHRSAECCSQHLLMFNSIFVRFPCFHIIFKNILETCCICQCNFTKKISDEFSKNNMLFSYQGKHFFEIISHSVFKTFCENFLS